MQKHPIDPTTSTSRRREDEAAPVTRSCVRFNVEGVDLSSQHYNLWTIATWSQELRAPTVIFVRRSAKERFFLRVRVKEARTLAGQKVRTNRPFATWRATCIVRACNVSVLVSRPSSSRQFDNFAFLVSKKSSSRFSNSSRDESKRNITPRSPKIFWINFE